MPKARPAHSAQRTISAITLGVAKSTEARRQHVAETALAETDQQYQIPVAGSAGQLPAFSFLAVFFDFPFHYAPGQRDSDLQEPHMTFGAKCNTNVMLAAAVQSWYVDPDTGAFTGAIVTVSAIAAAAATDFVGSLHVTFQGFSAPDDTEDTLTET